MRQRMHFPIWLPLAAAMCALASTALRGADLRRAVPVDAYLAVYGKHNPERDFQREHLRAVWDTVRETQILEQVLKIATSRVSEQNLEQAKSVLQEVRDAAAPINLAAIVDCKEAVYAQVWQTPTAQHLAILQLTPEAAASTEEGLRNLFRLVEKYSKGGVSVQTEEEGKTRITTLVAPQNVPFRPTLARTGDVLVLSSWEPIARKSLSMLAGQGGPSKFDDPRVKEALSHLPEPEDSLAFFDGRLYFSQLRELGQFVRKAGGNDPEAARVADLIEDLFGDLAIHDYEVAVEYTEDHRLCTASYGKLLPDVEQKLLAKILAGGQKFENWPRWVPADALAYSLSTGANLHPLYERVVAVIKEHIPEAQGALDQFEQLQTKYEVHLDRDILQAFSGEIVSVTLPAAQPSGVGGQESVAALRCGKPERIRELLHRLVAWLQQRPIVQAQQLQLVKSETLEGFEELSASVLAAVGAKPVIGFRDGWMMVGSSPGAVQRVLDAQAGRSPTIVEAESFKQCNLQIEGPVYAISYANVAEGVRRAAKTLNQVGVAAPAVLAMAAAQANQDVLKQVQQLLSLLPSAAKIVAKFDFLEARMSVTQAGEEPGSYRRRSVTLVRPK